ncbi:hypothetical protein HK099_000171 [Clydaea vesicula]|uniref:Band 7 domain-containing protein n=1 Tax=Clydaea vesicula TaxID=447962 RepID=A0AAD5TXK2_9FUNG|nr:hypothetical protein HK099_000171 [Clydaea vesicula]
MRYLIAKADEYLVLTGFNIADIVIVKKALVWPFQKCNRFAITPVNYTLSLQAMTAEKLEFTLPAVFTIGPLDEPEALNKYAHLLAGSDVKGESIQDLVRGVIEGETRVIAAGMTMEEIFKERKFFKEHVIKSVQAELSQFGLFIYNANVKQLTDTAGSEYFQYLRLKSHEGAVNQAKVEVAEAKYRGEVGEKKHLGLTRQENARIESQTVIFENERKKEVLEADAKLRTFEEGYHKNVEIAKIEAKKAAELRNAELQIEVEVKKALVEQERLRVVDLAKTKVTAEATIAEADAQYYKQKKEADAKLYQEMKTAEGLKAIFDVQAKGIENLNSAFGGNSDATLKYLMLEKGLYVDLANANAKAVQGLNPKITVWNTGSNGNEGDSTKPIRDIFQSLPPLLTTINEQTGVAPPSWLAKLNNAAPGSALNSSNTAAS